MSLIVLLLFLLVSEDVKAHRRCITPNGEYAECLPINRCSTFLNVIRTADDTSKSFMRASICQHEPELTVCCGSHATYKNRLTRKSLLPNRDVCGIQADTFKILGGENAGILEFPWLVAIQYKNLAGNLSFKCGGVLISERYVLTAAHCVTNPNLTVHRVRLGEWDLDSLDDCVGSGSFRQCTERPIDAEIEKILPHERYSRTQQGVFYDIALLRLKQPVTYSDTIRPICLPKLEERSSSGETVYVAGWGNTEFSNYSPIKQKLGVPIMAPGSCQEVYARSGVSIDESHICAGGERWRDSCKGDSGGPLMATVRDNPNQFYLEGIVSYGAKRCGSQGVPGVYTRVNKYLDWINSNISL